ALGAACLPGLQQGLFGSLQELAGHWGRERSFAPPMPEQRRLQLDRGWLDAVRGGTGTRVGRALPEGRAQAGSSPAGTPLAGTAAAATSADSSGSSSSSAGTAGTTTTSCSSRASAYRLQAAMNSAAISGPMTNPLRPKSAMPPRVEISTT